MRFGVIMLSSRKTVSVSMTSCTLIAMHQHFRPTSTLMMRAAGCSDTMSCSYLQNIVSQSNRL